MSGLFLKNRKFKYKTFNNERKLKIMRKLLALLLVFVFGITGCGSRNKQDVSAASAVEVYQNDYRGACVRVDSIRSNMINIVEYFNSLNMEIMTEKPSNYWDSSEFSQFSTDLINPDAYQYMSFCNEVETDWETAATLTERAFFAEGVNIDLAHSLSRTDANNYHMYIESRNRAAEVADWCTQNNDHIYLNYYAVYDPTHDWMETTRTCQPFNGKVDYEDMMIQYARIGNAFVIQTENERLYVVYESTDMSSLSQGSLSENGAAAPSDNVLQDGKIIAFYYSRLNGQPRARYILQQYENEVEQQIKDGTLETSVLDIRDIQLSNTMEDVITNRYNSVNDSIFSHLEDMGRDWVMEETDAAFAQTVIYENDTLTVRAINDMSGKIESYVFYADGRCDKSEETVLSLQEQLALDNEEQSVEDGPETLPAAYYAFRIEDNVSESIALNELGINGVIYELPVDIGNIPLDRCDFSKCGIDMDKYYFDGTGCGFEAENFNNLIFLSYDDVGKVIGAYTSGFWFEPAGLEVYPENMLVQTSFAGISIGMSKDGVQGILGAGTNVDGQIVYQNTSGALLVDYAMFNNEDGDSYWGVDELMYLSIYMESGNAE